MAKTPPPAQRPHEALIIVDVQNDFCPDGKLPVPQGDAVVPVLNRYIERAVALGMPIYASRDWHPKRTVHFAQEGGPWPEHCIQNTPGAAFRPDLQLPPTAVIVTKGDDALDHGYSAFEGHLGENPGDGPSLLQALQQAGVQRVYVGGLATDYCVKQTVLSARNEGLATVWLRDASLPVNIAPTDGDKAEEAMLSAGAIAITLARFPIEDTTAASASQARDTAGKRGD